MYLRIVNEFNRYFGKEPEIVVSAPARLDLLNTHQDYKGLPVISVAVNIRLYIALSKSQSDVVNVVSHNMRVLGCEYRDSFKVSNPNLINADWFGNYVRATVKYLRSKDFNIDGFNALIYSEIPMGAGLGSSGALLVALVKALSELYNLKLSKLDIAEHAFRIEHDIMKIPCGRLDQYSSAFGGHILINTKPPYNVERLNIVNAMYIVLDSGLRHKTIKVHTLRRRELEEALNMLLNMRLPKELRGKLNHDIYNVKWDLLNEDELVSYVKYLPKALRDRLIFTVRMNKSTKIFVKFLREGFSSIFHELHEVLGKSLLLSIDGDSLTLRLLGEIMSYQHRLLRDLYEVSTELLDKMVYESLKAGALGAKLSGAGLGGVVIALVTDLAIANQIMSRSLRLGALRGWVVREDVGVMVH